MKVSNPLRFDENILRFSSNGQIYTFLIHFGLMRTWTSRGRFAMLNLVSNPLRFDENNVGTISNLTMMCVSNPLRFDENLL